MTLDTQQSDMAAGPSEGFAGRVLRPTDDGYDEARQVANQIYNDARPRIIVQCTSADDVVAAVNCAVANDVSIAVRGGGHMTDGYAMQDGAYVIDLSPMKAIQVDPERGIATVEPGVLLGEMDAATQEYGLAIPSGTVSDTGVAGLVLGGGMGWLTRRFGMSVDNLISLEVVTVDGRKLVISDTEHSDLFWGMRGAGHNLAIATKFVLRAHPVGPQVLCGMILYSTEDAVSVMEELDSHLGQVPLGVSIGAGVYPALAAEGIPDDVVGKPVLSLPVVCTGDLDAAESAVASIAALARPLVNTVAPTSWVNANSMLDLLAPKARRHTRGGYLSTLSRDAAQVALEHIERAPAPTSAAASCAIVFPPVGGAVHDLDEDSMAFSRQGANRLWEVLAQWDGRENDDAYSDWADDAGDALLQLSLDNGYVNFGSDQGEAALEKLYGSPEKWRRLRALKREWDPENRLRHNKNIRPLGSPEAVRGSRRERRFA